MESTKMLNYLNMPAKGSEIHAVGEFVHVPLGEGRFAYSRRLLPDSPFRQVNYDRENRPIMVILEVGETGIDISELPKEKKVEQILRQRGIRIISKP
ncbi:MAG TPA: hypothetical protein VF189_04115 [Patescibacteria group bacterium]